MDENFREMTIKELEHQYSPSQWSHRMSADDVVNEHIQVVQINSEKAKQEVDCELGISYGDTAKQKLDIFGAKSLPNDAPVLFYIHGGYWQQLGREMSSYMSPVFTKAGAVVVAIGYDLAPDASMDEIVLQVKKAVTFVLKWANQRGSRYERKADIEFLQKDHDFRDLALWKVPNATGRGVYLCGHSAGGHLAAMMLAVDWMAECDCDLIKGAIPVAGVFDLRPLVKTYVNDPLRMTEASAWENSPLKHVQNVCIHSRHKQILIAVGKHDPPEFRRQSLQFYQELCSRDMKVEYLDIADKDHFDVIEHLRFEDYSLSKAIRNMMGLADE